MGSSVVKAAQVKAYMMEERGQASIALFLPQQLRITALLGGLMCSLGLQLVFWGWDALGFGSFVVGRFVFGTFLGWDVLYEYHN